MKLVVCIGSSCHLKGSRQVVEQLQQLIREHKMQDQIDLSGSFCLGRCQEGIGVTLDGAFYSLTPASVSAFFDKEILGKG